ncbi:MAG: hypothetical protein A2143_05875 [Gallionellales bacterium RBG_16_57_15]|nr:MAG: hypothetical protein A2143_05875 [Gallionellales bacterium RBG_16_57_15]
MKKFTVIVLSLVCAACALPNPAEFSRGDVDQKQFDRDDYECARDARSINGGNCDQMDLFEQCMKSKGYVPIPDSANNHCN